MYMHVYITLKHKPLRLSVLHYLVFLTVCYMYFKLLLLLVPEPQEDPYAPLHLQSYFHGQIPRAKAESLVRDDGDFLVRESSNKPGQYVLTGLSNGRSQHLLLIDKSGKVN